MVFEIRDHEHGHAADDVDPYGHAGTMGPPQTNGQYVRAAVTPPVAVDYPEPTVEDDIDIGVSRRASLALAAVVIAIVAAYVFLSWQIDLTKKPTEMREAKDLLEQLVWIGVLPFVALLGGQYLGANSKVKRVKSGRNKRRRGRSKGRR